MEGEFSLEFVPGPACPSGWPTEGRTAGRLGAGPCAAHAPGQGRTRSGSSRCHSSQRFFLRHTPFPSSLCAPLVAPLRGGRGSGSPFYGHASAHACLMPVPEAGNPETHLNAKSLGGRPPFTESVCFPEGTGTQ